MSVRDVNLKDLEPLLQNMRAVLHHQHMVREATRHLLREEWTGGGLHDPGEQTSYPPRWLRLVLGGSLPLSDQAWFLEEILQGRIRIDAGDVEVLHDIIAKKET